MFLMSYTNISPSFILILNSIQEKQKNIFQYAVKYMLMPEILKYVDS